MNTAVKPTRFERHIDIRQGGVRAIDWLVGQSILDKCEAERAVGIGAVWLTRGVTERLRSSQQVLKYGDQLHVYYDQEIINRQPAEPQCLHDHQRYSIWNKPSGMRGEGTRFGDHCSLSRWVETHGEEERQVHFIYRLDQTISGLMLLAHDDEAANALATQFQQGRLDIEYRAWVHGLTQFEAELIDQPVRGKPARSRVATLFHDQEQERSLLDIRLETGRKHQLRQHLSSLDYPLVGDRLYGNCREEQLQLQVVGLRFTCPLTAKSQQVALPTDLRIDRDPAANHGELILSPTGS